MKEEESPKRRLNTSTIILSFILISISISFFSVLDLQTSPNFSPGEENPNDFAISTTIFAIIVAIFGTSFLIWLKHFMQKSPYLGLVIGIVSLGLFVYAILQKFVGPYTTGFTALISLVVLVYLGIYFHKFHKQDYKRTDDEDPDNS